MIKLRLLCIFSILSGIGLFVFTPFFLSAFSVFPWCLGLASALIILGLGYLINTLLFTMKGADTNNRKSIYLEQYRVNIIEKAGYLDCKIMHILLCIYLLILNEMRVNSIILAMSIALVVIQFLLDLIFQIYLMRYNKKKENAKEQ